MGTPGYIWPRELNTPSTFFSSIPREVMSSEQIPNVFIPIRFARQALKLMSSAPTVNVTRPGLRFSALAVVISAATVFLLRVQLGSPVLAHAPLEEKL